MCAYGDYALWDVAVGVFIIGFCWVFASWGFDFMVLG
jgi:hypothetical protein